LGREGKRKLDDTRDERDYRTNQKNERFKVLDHDDFSSLFVLNGLGWHTRRLAEVDELLQVQPNEKCARNLGTCRRSEFGWGNGPVCRTFSPLDGA
jgi:hypothetical protein